MQNMLKIVQSSVQYNQMPKHNLSKWQIKKRPNAKTRNSQMPKQEIAKWQNRKQPNGKIIFVQMIKFHNFAIDN